MVAQYITGIQHIGIPTNDIEQTIEFYKKLGFQAVYQTQNSDESVAFLQLQNLVIETYENKQATHRAGALDHVALDTTNIEAAYQAAQTAGLSIEEGGIQFLPFWENGVRFFKVKGPNGESLEFCQRLQEG